MHSLKQLAVFVRDCRKVQKLTQGDVAERAYLKQTTISAFENKPESTKLETFFRILSASGVEIDLRSKHMPQDEGEWQEEW